MKTSKYLSLAILAMSIAACGGGADTEEVAASDNVDDIAVVVDQSTPSTSPVRQIDRNGRRGGNGGGHGDDRGNANDEIRSIDGTGNNRQNTQMNGADTDLARVTDPGYGDLVASLAGDQRPSARAISNAVNAQSGSVPNSVSASDFLWQWGQFVDHDIDLTDGVDPAEPAEISIPSGDAWFDTTGTGTMVFPFNRSIYNETTGTSTTNPRQQVNEISGWIDASNVYGSDADRADTLRRNDGSGKLATSTGELLPFNVQGLANAGGSGSELFLAGDVRANEQLGLTSLHTLFVREHNRLADQIAVADSSLSGEEVYQAARRIVSAQMQVITFEEFLPVLLGRGAIRPYRGYEDNVDASIMNVFSAAAYRLGHSMLSAQILRLDAAGNESGAGHLPLRNAFFAPQRLASEGGIEPLLRGLAAQECQRIDVLIVDDVRNFLFGSPGAGGFDLASLNIQRGRDHGLSSYNEVRGSFGLSTNAAFSDISSNLELQDKLSSIYGSTADIDVWVGGLAEDPVDGSMLGELFHRIVVRQFEVLRDGDRFWYERSLSDSELRQVRGVRLADIIRRNTSIDSEIGDNVFVVGRRP